MTRKKPFTQEDYRALFSALSGIDYVIIGGVASIIHGSNMNTTDVDLYILNTEENILRLETALEKIGFTGKRSRRQTMILFSHKGKGLYIDVWLNQQVPYEEIKVDKKKIYNEMVRVASIESVIDLLKSSGRTEDKYKAERLADILYARKGR